MLKAEVSVYPFPSSLPNLPPPSVFFCLFCLSPFARPLHTLPHVCLGVCSVSFCGLSFSLVCLQGTLPFPRHAAQASVAAPSTHTPTPSHMKGGGARALGHCCLSQRGFRPSPPRWVTGQGETLPFLESHPPNLHLSARQEGKKKGKEL